jgi:hypothetical protein
MSTGLRAEQRTPFTCTDPLDLQEGKIICVSGSGLVLQLNQPLTHNRTSHGEEEG